MSDKSVARTSDGGEVTVFRPEEAKQEVAKAEAIIEYGKRVRDLSIVESGVEHLIEQAREFVGWWEVKVRNPGNQPNNSDLNYLSVENAVNLTGISQVQVSRWRKRLQDEDQFREALIAPVRKKWMGEKGQTDQKGASGTGVNEWYTPPEHIETARRVLDHIDLDPASSEAANDRVRAEQYFTQADNGLDQEWSGKVWMNPPYAQPAIQQFVEKLVSEYQSGRVTEAIALTHNYTDTRWFQHAAMACRAICFTRGRIGFLSPSGERAAPTQGQAFFYFGDNPERFAEQFRGIGFVVMLMQGQGGEP